MNCTKERLANKLNEDFRRELTGAIKKEFGATVYVERSSLGNNLIIVESYKQVTQEIRMFIKAWSDGYDTAAKITEKSTCEQ